MLEVPSDQYARSFEMFLAHTDEKQVFINEFSKYIDQYRPFSVLDIGAGNGSLAIPVAALVKRYVAIEPNHKYASRLRDAGLPVVEEPYPTPMPDTYDLVIMSHVISYEAANHQELLSAAWHDVAPGGHLLAVTHRGDQPDDWSNLLNAIGWTNPTPYRDIYQEILTLLTSRGTVSVREVVTTLDTDNLEDMLQAMAFVASGGRSEDHSRFLAEKEILSKVLQDRYLTAEGFSFPFKHFFIDTYKDEKGV